MIGVRPEHFPNAPWNHLPPPAISLCMTTRATSTNFRTTRARAATTIALAMMLCMTLCASTALAQAPKKEAPTAPIATTTRTGDSDWVTMLLVGVLAVAMVGVNFIPSKRGHQD